jgi:mono/diheme cytochrome c family protein
MKRILLWLFFPIIAQAQNLPDVLKQGQEVFSRTCSNGYCHGPSGAGGGAPRIAARGFEQAYINNVVTRGIPNTAMQSFSNTLSRADLNALVAYVASLNGIANPVVAAGPAAPAAPALSGDAAKGRDLFFDAVRSFGRCSTCHEVGGIGIPVAAPISAIPANAAALKALATPRVSTVTVGGESMPGLTISNRSTSVMFYDLTVAPPVLRTETPAAVRNTDGSNWRHSSVIGAYTDAELSSILAYLQAALKP